ncbi:MAG: hypothetical protein N3B21_07810 [Clostridia bacterium]|nr:hypothetical protein [Clostridia bacterium]
MSEEFYSKGSLCTNSCEAKVSNAQTLPECPSENIKPIGINGPLVAKIPVVIAQPKVQIDVKAIIELEEPAIEIKRIKKNLFLTQCKLINIGDDKKGKLFLSGFIRKNIEYATANCTPSHDRAISGDIRHTTVDVPFECVTMVEFVNRPVFCKSGFVKETEIFLDKSNSCDICNQDIVGHNPCEKDFEHFECFSEKVFCELEDVKIFEEDLLKRPTQLSCEFPNLLVFDKFTEKMVIFVRIKLLQNQQVNIPSYSGSHNNYDDDKHKKQNGYTDKWPWLKHKHEKKNKHKYGNYHQQYKQND